MRAPFCFGDREIRPGARATVDIPLMGLSIHAPVTMSTHVVHGRRQGPVLFVCAALHGDEINGVEVIRRLLKLSALKTMRGTLLAVPIVNVFGFLNHSRYLPDRRDLNRSFPGSPKGSLAGRLAHLFLHQIVAKSDYGVDLHTGAIRRTNFPQIRADLDDPETAAIAHSFGVPLIINAGLRQGSLRAAAGEIGTRVLVYEAGEALRFDETSIRAGVKGVVRVMQHLGMISRRSGRPHEPLVIRNSRWERASMSGILRSIVEPGTAVRKDQLLGLIADPFGENETEIRASYEGILIGGATLPVVHEGDALYHIGQMEGAKASADALDAFEPNQAYDTGTTAEISGEPQIV